RGTFHVNRKVKDEISYEFNNAPMPYAIYFTNYGHAFHMGDPAYDSAGCVRLPEQAALRYWNNLQIGDKVVIYYHKSRYEVTASVTRRLLERRSPLFCFPAQCTHPNP